MEVTCGANVLLIKNHSDGSQRSERVICDRQDTCILQAIITRQFPLPIAPRTNRTYPGFENHVNQALAPDCQQGLIEIRQRNPERPWTRTYRTECTQ